MEQTAELLPPPTTPGGPERRPSVDGSGSGGRRDRRDSREALNWREEQAQLHHQLRLLKGELAAYQTKLGIKQSPVPFGSSSRKTSLSADASSPVPLRKASISDLSSHHRSSPTPEPRDCGVSSTSPRAIGLPRLSPVALNRALVSNEGVDNLQIPDGLPRDETLATRPNGGRLSAENPFFGSGNSRERMQKSSASASSGSGKVISGLQSDLLQTRSALEGTRSQLRLSQRAVESLGRQNDDLKETKERLGNEIDGLNRALARKERLQEEALARARVAEASLAELQQTHRIAMSSHKVRLKELEEGKHKSDELRAKAESEYGALSRGMKSMSEGWRADLSWLKSDITKAESRVATSSSAVTKIIQERPAAQVDVKFTLASLENAQQAYLASHTAATSAVLSDLRQAQEQMARDHATAEELSAEFVRLRRMMAEHTL